jgi:hypothetical protein
VKRPHTNGTGNVSQLLGKWRPASAKASLRLAADVARAMESEAPGVTLSAAIIVASRRRRVMIIEEEGFCIALDWDSPRGTRLRVDHELGIARYREVLPELQRLRRALRGTDVQARSKAWKTAGVRFPVCARLEAQALVTRLWDAVGDATNEAIENIAAHLVRAENPGAPRPSVILKDRSNPRFTLRRPTRN